MDYHEEALIYFNIFPTISLSEMVKPLKNLKHLRYISITLIHSVSNLNQIGFVHQNINIRSVVFTNLSHFFTKKKQKIDFLFSPFISGIVNLKLEFHWLTRGKRYNNYE